MAASPTPRHAPCCTISFVPLFLSASERYEIVVESPAPPKRWKEKESGRKGKVDEGGSGESRLLEEEEK